MNTGTQVLAYLRVSTQEQGDSQLGLQAQRQVIEQACAARGWVLVGVEQDIATGKDLKRPGLARALDRCKADGLVLVSAKLDRISRSVHDFSGLLDRSLSEGWSLLVLDAGIDTSTPNGRAMVGMIAVFAQLERELIGERTKAALSVARQNGVRLGRPRADGPRHAHLRERCSELRESGLSLQAIADRMMADGEPTVSGGFRWYAATVKRHLAPAS
jgi:DNA invertase Pin-like site-specific DNA recombinase